MCLKWNQQGKVKAQNLCKQESGHVAHAAKLPLVSCVFVPSLAMSSVSSAATSNANSDEDLVQPQCLALGFDHHLVCVVIPPSLLDM